MYKNQKIKRIIFIFIVSFGIISCSTEDENKIDNSKLVGEWKWTNTNGGFNGHINETPSTTGKSIELDLNVDYSYTIKENGSEISKGKYSLTMKESIYSVEAGKFIFYSENQQIKNAVLSGIIRFEENQMNKMKISDNNHDGISSIFEKVE